MQNRLHFGHNTPEEFVLKLFRYNSQPTMNGSPVTVVEFSGISEIENSPGDPSDAPNETVFVLPNQKE